MDSGKEESAEDEEVGDLLRDSINDPVNTLVLISHTGYLPEPGAIITGGKLFLLHPNWELKYVLITLLPLLTVSYFGQEHLL